MPLQRAYNIKVYSPDGVTLQKSLTTERPDDATMMYVKNDPNFKTIINGGQGECVLDVSAPFDNFSEGTVINFMNVVRIYCVTINTSVSPPTQTSTLIYTGYVSRYEPYVDQNGNEGVHVTCLGLVSLLTRSYYGSPNTFSVTQTTVDPEAIAKDVIDKFNAVYSGSLIGYAGTTSTVGTNVTYTFTEQKWFDALNTTIGMAGTGWWWAIREDGNLYFKAKPSSATHRLTMGRDIASIKALKDAEKVINDIILKRSGGTVTTYADATSKSTYGTGSPATGKISEIISDSSVPNGTTADQFGNKELADKKDAKISAQVTVNTNYPIDTIHVGDTCEVLSTRTGNTFFGSNNLLIVSVDYKGDTVVLELEQLNANLGTALDQFVNG
jgi:hypothetical protein